MRTIISLSLLAVVTLVQCQEQEQMIVFTLQGVLEKLESISDTLKVHAELLQRIPDLHRELENVKGVAVENQESLHRLRRETGQCLQGVDLDPLMNASAATHQEIKSFHEKMSEVISLAQKDECSEGSLPCGEKGICHDTLFNFTCSCPSGFTWDGSDCADIDECAEDEVVCSPNAICKNSIGSYSCSCNKPFEGDGKTSCEFQCRYPAKMISGLGCIKAVAKIRTFSESSTFCREEGGRVLQHFNGSHLIDVGKTFEYHAWVGIYKEKWTSDESVVPRDIWAKGFGSDPLRRCGYLGWESFSSSRKVTQLDCSERRYVFCQFQPPENDD